MRNLGKNEFLEVPDNLFDEHPVLHFNIFMCTYELFNVTYVG